MSQSIDSTLPPANGAYPTAYSTQRSAGVVPLRPLLVTEILDGAVTATRRHPGIMLGLSAIVVALGQLVSIPLDYFYLRYLAGLVDSSNSPGTVLFLAVLRPGTFVTVLVRSLLVGLLIITVSRSVLGRPAPLREVWAATRPKLWRLIGLTLLIYGFFIGVILLGALPGILLAAGAGGSGPGDAVLVLGVIGGTLVAVNRMVAWLLAPAALVLEDQPIRVALKRSSVLVKTSWWQTLGTWLLASVVAELVAGILVVLEQVVIGSGLSPVTSYSDGTYSGHTVSWATVFLSAAFGTAIQAVVAPFVGAVTALMYVDRRMRREALDIELTRSQWQGGASAAGARAAAGFTGAAPGAVDPVA